MEAYQRYGQKSLIRHFLQGWQSLKKTGQTEFYMYSKLHGKKKNLKDLPKKKKKKS